MDKRGLYYELATAQQRKEAKEAENVSSSSSSSSDEDDDDVSQKLNDKSKTIE